MLKPLLAPLLLILPLAVAGCSAQAPPAESATVEKPGQPSLDTLFAKLQTTENPHEAQILEVAIRHVWARSGDRTADRLLLRALDAIHRGELDEAMFFLNRTIEAAPGFAEAWNQRAMVHFLRDEYAEAILSLKEVLDREPRHFGALMGLARIFLVIGDDEAALHAFEAALKLNPHLAEARAEVNELRESLAGVPI